MFMLLYEMGYINIKITVSICSIYERGQYESEIFCYRDDLFRLLGSC